MIDLWNQYEDYGITDEVGDDFFAELAAVECWELPADEVEVWDVEVEVAERERRAEVRRWAEAAREYGDERAAEAAEAHEDVLRWAGANTSEPVWCSGHKQIVVRNSVRCPVCEGKVAVVNRKGVGVVLRTHGDERLEPVAELSSEGRPWFPECVGSDQMVHGPTVECPRCGRTVGVFHKRYPGSKMWSHVYVARHYRPARGEDRSGARTAAPGGSGGTDDAT